MCKFICKEQIKHPKNLQKIENENTPQQQQSCTNSSACKNYKTSRELSFWRQKKIDEFENKKRAPKNQRSYNFGTHNSAFEEEHLKNKSKSKTLPSRGSEKEPSEIGGPLRSWANTAEASTGDFREVIKFSP